MFTVDSGLVKVWIRLVEQGSQYTKDNVPSLSNLREIVLQVLEEKGL